MTRTDRNIIGIVIFVLALCTSLNFAFASPPASSAPPPASSAPVTQAAPGASMAPFSIMVEGFGTLNPKPNISPQDSAWLTILLVIGFRQPPGYNYPNPDFAGFIRLHHLEKQFDPVSSAPVAKP